MWLPRRRLPASEDPSVTVGPPDRKGPVHWALVVAGIALTGCLYVWLADQLVATTNQNPLAQDQKNNMRLALEARSGLAPNWSRGVGAAVREWLPHRTDGVVAPLWPWVAARVAREGHTIETSTFEHHTPADLAFFQRGKWLNVWISGLFLAAVGLWVGRRWTVLATLNFVLLGMLGAVLPRAVAFQPEPVYFILFFLCWVAGWALCARNPLGAYAIFGLLCGLACLAKSSIQPFMAVWFGAMAVRFLLGLWVPSDRWSATRHVVGVFIWVAAFFLVMAPRLAYGQEKWGRPFFSYPSVWMWMDDFPTGYAWMGEHPDAAALDRVPRNEWPSPQRYQATHSADQMLTRLRSGLVGEDGTLRTFLIPKGSGKHAGTPEKPWKRLLEPRGAYLAALAIIAVAATGLARRGRSRESSREATNAGATHSWPALLSRGLMVVGATTAFTLLYAWYVPIGRGDRFMLSLWLPIVFSLTAWAEGAIRPITWGPRRWTYAALHAGLLACLLGRLIELTRAPFFDPKLY